MMEELLRWLGQWNPPALLWNLAIVGGALLLGLLTAAALWLMARAQQRMPERYRLAGSLLRHLSIPVTLFLPIFLLDLMYPELKGSRAQLRNGAHALEIGQIASMAWILLRSLKVLQDLVLARIDIHRANNLRQRRILTQLAYIRKVIGSVIVLLAIGAILLTFATLRKVGTGLLTGVGIGGIIIGFAAQRSLANLLAGFQIAFTQPIRLDDQVVVEGQFGNIEEITLTYVVVRIWDDRRLILPITWFIEKPFENWTRTTADLLGTIFYYVDYSVPLAHVRQEFVRYVQAHPLWDGRAAALIVSDNKADVMEIRGLVSARNAGALFDLRCAAREHLMQYIAEKYPDALPKQRLSGQQ